ncbi:MAG: CRISPR-associated endonuclease Cas3'' [Sulfurovum sp.]
MLNMIYANTNGQRLDQHLFAVGYLAKCLIKKVVPNEPNLAEAVYIAGCWHDIGKIDNNFQSWIVKELNKQKKYKDISDDGEHIEKGTFSWDKYPRHNEFSLLLFHIFYESKLNSDSLDRVKHTIYWHHAKPIRNKKSEIKTLVDIYTKIADFEDKYSDTISMLNTILSSVEALSNEYNDEEDTKINRVQIPHLDYIEDSLEGLNLGCRKTLETTTKSIPIF